MSVQFEVYNKSEVQRHRSAEKLGLFTNFLFLHIFYLLNLIFIYSWTSLWKVKARWSCEYKMIYRNKKLLKKLKNKSCKNCALKSSNFRQILPFELLLLIELIRIHYYTVISISVIIRSATKSDARQAILFNRHFQKFLQLRSFQQFFFFLFKRNFKI